MVTAAFGPLDPAALAAALALGFVLGLGYFGGLWWTLTRLGRWRRPGVALAVSFALRAVPVLVAFVLLARSGLAPLFAAFAGFLAVRVVASSRLARGGARGGAPGRARGEARGGDA